MNNNENTEAQATQGVQVSNEEVSSMFTCYICDTEVPKTHMRIHLEGERHQTCLRIVDIALERARRQLDLEVQPLYEQDIRVFYCDPCSVVLLTSDKIFHEQSETHIENVQYYNILRTFSAFYMNREAYKYKFKESDDVLTAPTRSAETKYKEISKEAELKAVINQLKQATDYIQSPGRSIAAYDPNLNKALNGLKLTVDRTLHKLQETVAKKEAVFDKALNNLKESAEKTLHELKESAEIKHQTDLERSKLSEEAELEIFKFKNKLSRMNMMRKNKKNTNLLSQPMNCICDDDPKKAKKIGSLIRERMRSTFGSSKPNQSSPPK